MCDGEASVCFCKQQNEGRHVFTFIPGCWLMAKKQKVLGRACDAIACPVDM